VLGGDYRGSSRRLIGEKTAILCLSCTDRVDRDGRRSGGSLQSFLLYSIPWQRLKSLYLTLFSM
jgi:hypothetical protein